MTPLCFRQVFTLVESQTSSHALVFSQCPTWEFRPPSLQMLPVALTALCLVTCSADGSLSCSDCVTVSGAGTSTVNGDYQRATPNSAHTWVDTGKAYYVLSPATDGDQQGLIDLYFNKDSGGWKISLYGREQYSADTVYGTWTRYNFGADPAPTVSVSAISSQTTSSTIALSSCALNIRALSLGCASVSVAAALILWYFVMIGISLCRQPLRQRSSTCCRVASGMHVFATYFSLLYGLHKVISCIKADFSLVKKVSLTDLKVALSKRMRGLLTWCIQENSWSLYHTLPVIACAVVITGIITSDVLRRLGLSGERRCRGGICCARPPCGTLDAADLRMSTMSNGYVWKWGIPPMK